MSDNGGEGGHDEQHHPPQHQQQDYDNNQQQQQQQQQHHHLYPPNHDPPSFDGNAEPPTPLTPNDANSVPNSPPDSARQPGSDEQYQHQHDGHDGNIDGMQQQYPHDDQNNGMPIGGVEVGMAVEIRASGMDHQSSVNGNGVEGAPSSSLSSNTNVEMKSPRVGEPSPPDSPNRIAMEAQQLRSEQHSRNANDNEQFQPSQVPPNDPNPNDNSSIPRIPSSHGSRNPSRAGMLPSMNNNSRPQSVAGVRPPSSNNNNPPPSDAPSRAANGSRPPSVHDAPPHSEPQASMNDANNNPPPHDEEKQSHDSHHDQHHQQQHDNVPPQGDLGSPVVDGHDDEHPHHEEKKEMKRGPAEDSDDDSDDDHHDKPRRVAGPLDRHRSLSPHPHPILKPSGNSNANNGGNGNAYHVGLTDEDIENDQLPPDDDDDDFDSIIMPQLDDDGFRERIAEIRHEQKIDLPNPLAEEDIDNTMVDQVVVLDSISLKDISDQEHAMERDRMAALAIAEERWQRRLREMDTRQRETSKQLATQHSKALSEIRNRKQNEASRHANQLKWQTEAFTTVAEKLLANLEQQQEAVKKQYGGLLEHHPIYPDGANRGRKVEYQRASEPRLLRIRVDWLRCVKNKLPYGNYVVMVTLYDRLGGHPMRWSKLPDGKGYCHFATTSTSKPAAHGGKWNNIELSFNGEGNEMILVCPSRHLIRPQMCLVFEVFAVRGGRNKCDHVVAWGAFPMCYSNFEIITGRYKVPLLRGELDLRIDKYETLERTIANDIDSWLCNLYFEAEIVPLEVEYGCCGLIPTAYHYDVRWVEDPNRKRLDWDDKFVREDKQRNEKYAQGKFRPKPKMRFGRFGGLGGGDDDRENPEVAAKLLAERKKAREQATLRSDYKFSVTNVESDAPGNKKKEKIRFFISELASDMGYSRFSTLEFWITIFLLCLVFWFRLYLHYLGEWLYLVKVADIPVYQFDASAFTVIIGYNEKDATVIVQGIVAGIGHVFNILIYFAMVAATWAVQGALGGFPETGYRLVMCWGVGAMLDPLLVLLVDCIREDFVSGDSFKLYQYFLRTDGYGAAGALLTILLNAILISVAAVIFYGYILKVHMNGRLLDIYDRLHGDEGAFFIPEDREISLTTLRFIVAKSKLKRTHGTQRKFLSESYTIEDHLDPKYKDTRLHITLWNVTPPNPPIKPDESRELYREFIRTDDGAIIEIFDDVDSLGAVDYKKMEEKKYFDRQYSVEDREREIQDRLHQVSDEAARENAEREKRTLNQKWGPTQTTSDDELVKKNVQSINSTIGNMGLLSANIHKSSGLQIDPTGSVGGGVIMLMTANQQGGPPLSSHGLSSTSSLGGLTPVVESSTSHGMSSLSISASSSSGLVDRNMEEKRSANTAIPEIEEEEEEKTHSHHHGNTGDESDHGPSGNVDDGDGEGDEEQQGALFGVEEEEEEDETKARHGNSNNNNNNPQPPSGDEQQHHDGDNGLNSNSHHELTASTRAAAASLTGGLQSVRDDQHEEAAATPRVEEEEQEEHNHNNNNNE